MLAAFELTAIAKPAVRFRGSFQCRLATDPDAFDDPWGQDSSFGMYAVQGPDPDHPDEPPLDRIIRFSGAVAPRPFCPPIGVRVTEIEAQVGADTVKFDAGDALIGQPVELGPQCVFDGRNRHVRARRIRADRRLPVEHRRPCSPAPPRPRCPVPRPTTPPPSTAPYANGDASSWTPTRTGGTPGRLRARRRHLGGATAGARWPSKQARLVAQPTARRRGPARIRDRRIREHIDARPGHGLGAAIATPMVFRGALRRADRPGGRRSPRTRRGTLAYLASLPAIRFTADFLAFDTDCQTGRVTGTLDAPGEPDGGRSTAPAREAAALRRPRPAGGAMTSRSATPGSSTSVTEPVVAELAAGRRGARPDEPIAQARLS